jgi:hypothetical protein
MDQHQRDLWFQRIVRALEEMHEERDGQLAEIAATTAGVKVRDAGAIDLRGCEPRDGQRPRMGGVS